MDAIAIEEMLEKSGFAREQAKGVIKAIQMASDRLATKQDLKELELKLKLFTVMNSVAIIGVLSALKYFG